MSDEELYRQYLLGKTEALDELLLRHKDGLTFFLLSYVKNISDAEDLMMDTFALLLTKKVTFRGDSSFKTWLYGIGRNLSRNHIRKNAHVVLNDFEEDFLGYYNVDIDGKLIKNDEKKALYEAMNKLREDYRTVLHLIYFENMDIKETALVMKKSVKQVYNLVSRAKEQLRSQLSGIISL